MRTYLSTYFFIRRFVLRRVVLVALLSLGFVQIAWLDAPPAHAAGGATREPAQGLATAESDTASGAVEDTLKACMTRIPKDASIGQRMVAVESCQRDEGDRKSLESVPRAESASQ